MAAALKGVALFNATLTQISTTLTRMGQREAELQESVAQLQALVLEQGTQIAALRQDLRETRDQVRALQQALRDR